MSSGGIAWPRRATSLQAAEDVAAERLVGKRSRLNASGRAKPSERSVNSSPTARPSETVVCCASAIGRTKPSL
jgi:hypothetical protein